MIECIILIYKYLKKLISTLKIRLYKILKIYIKKNVLWIEIVKKIKNIKTLTFPTGNKSGSDKFACKVCPGFFCPLHSHW